MQFSGSCKISESHLQTFGDVEKHVGTASRPRAHEHRLMGLAYEHSLMRLAHQHGLIGQAQKHVLIIQAFASMSDPASDHSKFLFWHL